jgi:quercetin dioxygenase-like cupin family protein/alkylhydroperoxidase/carboxymuconolactone decarboxylase family protein YurZ
MKKEGLNTKQEKIVAIAAFTANGDLQKLKTALNEGLDAGLTINEIKEILVQMYAYAGFPRSLNGINTFIGVLEEREKKGIKDELGKEQSPMPANKSSIELGTEIQTRLIGAPATGKYIAFAPAIDTFLKGHLFGDIFGRDNLDFQSREIATISALAAIDGVNPQLQSHFNIGLNVGLTEAQLRSLISVLALKVGKKEADNADEILGKVLSDRQGKQPAVPSAGAQAATKEDALTICITRSGSQPPSQGSAEYFTGSVRIDPLFKANDPLRASGGRVTFEPGARTAWHTHPFGQILIVTAGSGWVQQWGGPIEEIRQGDVVRIPPGLKHWHGATAATGMTHIAIQEQLDDKAVEWMEKVSDEQYRRILCAKEVDRS